MDLLIIGFLHEKWRISLIPKNFYRESLTMNVKISKSIFELEILRHDKRIVIKIHSDPLKRTDELELTRNTKSISVFQMGIDRNQRFITAMQHILSNFRIFLQNFEIDDSGLTIDTLKLGWRQAILKTHNFTETDLNRLLIDWKEGSHKRIRHLVIHVQDGFEIGKILENVEVEPWNPEKRDRKFILREINGIYPPPLDLATGHDMYNKNGKLGTVHLVGNEFHLCVWTRPFCREFLIQLFSDSVRSYDDWLERKCYQSDKKRRMELLEDRAKKIKSLENLKQ